jgi:hypothetical protein
MRDKKLYRVFYSETIDYEDYVEADSEEEAMEIFRNTLLHSDTLEPINMDVNEFVAEETQFQSKLKTGLI